MQSKNTSLPTLPEETESSNTTTLSEQNAAKDVRSKDSFICSKIFIENFLDPQYGNSYV